MTKKIAVIDGNSLMHRAYHAVPPTMNAPDGTPTNAVFGFLSMLLKFVDMAAPDAVICAFDAGKPTFRVEAMEQYKAQRPHMDDELRVQFPIMEHLLESLSIPVVKVQGWEGDDILGTIAARDEALGFETLLVTGDKDAYQLASELTRIVTTKKGITDVAIYGPAEVEERYGVTPAQFPDFLGLMGDTADNIPGIAGVGPKTATKFLQTYGSLEGLFEHTSELKGKMREKVEQGREDAFLSRKIATIVRDLDFECDIEQAAFPAFSADAATEAFKAYGLISHLKRVLSYLGDDATGAQLELKYEPILQGEEARALVESALAADELMGVRFASPEEGSLFALEDRLVVATKAGVASFAGEEALEFFARLVREGRFASFDAKADFHKVYPSDSSEKARVGKADLLDAKAFDLGLAGYVLNSQASGYGAAELAERYLDATLPTSDDVLVQAAIEAAAALVLAGKLRTLLEEEESWDAYARIDAPLAAVLTLMEREGAAIDTARLAELGANAQAELDELRTKALELAGEEFNLDSPKQLSHILFEVIGLTPTKKTRSGYSTDASVLKELSSVHELPGLILRYRELAKIKSTYIDALPRMRGADGLVHTSFNEMVTATGRLSSSEPNLQNIPVRTAFGRQIRECFVAHEGDDFFLSADYSQIELRLLAHLSGDQGLIDAFCSGADFHANTAARVFGLPADQVTPELRSRAKAVNFGIVYGQQAFGLSQSLGISFGEAKEMIERYFAAYPGVRAYLDQTIADAKECGFAQTMAGRKRHIPELHARNQAQRAFGERTAMNHPMQGTAADIIKEAMIRVQRRLVAEGFKAKLIIQVHDELDFSVSAAEVEALAALVKEEMEAAASLSVPLLADVKWDRTWAGAH